MVIKGKADLVKEALDRACECEFTYHGCSQCIILALQEVFSMRDNNLFKAASGLAGGIGQMHDTCGALLGASLMLGLRFGRRRDEIGDTEKLMSSLLPVGKLYKWFEKEYGSVKCRDIRARTLGAYYDTKIPWQAELALEAGLYKVCSELVGKVAAKTAEMFCDAAEDED
jgi:C_GCAxxG_C_C family probable redox protein